MTNKYIKHSHISEAKFRQLLYLFSLDLEAMKIASIAKLNRNTVNRYLSLIRKRIVTLCESRSDRETDVRNLSFRIHGNLPVNSRNGRLNGMPLVGITTDGEKISTYIIPIADISSLNSLKIGAHGCLGIADINNTKLVRIQTDSAKKCEENEKISEIESFWSYSKRRLDKFQGISKSTFAMHLKECEFRYNNRDQSLYKILLSEFRKRPVS